MGGITLEDLSQSRAYQEIFGLGEARGEVRGRTQEMTAVTLRLLDRRCGSLSDATTARIQGLPLEQLEALAEALLDYRIAGLRLQRPRRPGGLVGCSRLSVCSHAVAKWWNWMNGWNGLVLP